MHELTHLAEILTEVNAAEASRVVGRLFAHSNTLAGDSVPVDIRHVFVVVEVSVGGRTMKMSRERLLLYIQR